VAGKTGTSSDYTNAWFVGFTPRMVTAIWIGNDRQGQAMKYKTGNIGSGAAARLWSGYMREALNGKAVMDFREPPGIVWANVDPKSGKAVPDWQSGGDTYREVFAEDNVPQSGMYKLWRWFFPGKKAEATPNNSLENNPDNEEDSPPSNNNGIINGN
jgi:penicillin-binding protein 1A